MTTTVLEATKLARKTLFSQLHVIELWMPQIANRRSCNLNCQHCYVPASGRSLDEIMPLFDYQAVLRKVMAEPAYGGKWDVVFPGMEPLLHPEHLFPLTELANKLGARSIGMTTNGLLLKEEMLERVAESPITTINISLDGARAETHNAQRRANVFDTTIKNMTALSLRAPKIRFITNSTITRLNYREVGKMVDVSNAAGASFAAFHPFEVAMNADVSLALQPEEIASVINSIIEAVRSGAGSAAIEFESSTVGAFLCAWKQGFFQDMRLVTDETGFLFFWKRFGKREMVVNIMFYPHHFIRTLRVMDDGSLSSCRWMAIHGWNGVGNLRWKSLENISKLPEVIGALAQIWQEFLDQIMLFPAEFKSFTKFMEEGR